MPWATQGKFQTLKLLFFQILSFSFLFTPITRLVKFPSLTKLHSSHLSPSPPTLGFSAFLSGIISSLVFHYPHLLLSQSIFHTTARMIFSEQIWYVSLQPKVLHWFCTQPFPFPSLTWCLPSSHSVAPIRLPLFCCLEGILFLSFQNICTFCTYSSIFWKAFPQLYDK